MALRAMCKHYITYSFSMWSFLNSMFGSLVIPPDIKEILESWLHNAKGIPTSI